VKISGREVKGIVRGVAMLAGCQIGGNDFAELGVSEETAGKSIDQ
jgi:hypothetical protein